VAKPVAVLAAAGAALAGTLLSHASWLLPPLGSGDTEQAGRFASLVLRSNSGRFQKLTRALRSSHRDTAAAAAAVKAAGFILQSDARQASVCKWHESLSFSLSLADANFFSATTSALMVPSGAWNQLTCLHTCCCPNS